MTDPVPVSPLSAPCCIVSSLTLAALFIIVWSSYRMGADIENRGTRRYLSGSMWASLGCCMACTAIAVVKFVE